jgi:hypothetical protein
LPLFASVDSPWLCAAQGYDSVVKKLEALGSQGGTPAKEAVIADCGELPAAA